MGLPTGDDYVDELVRSLAGPRGGAGRDALKDGDARTSRTSREGDGFDFDAFDFDAFARRERRREREYHAAWDAICRHADFASFREELPDSEELGSSGGETRERAGPKPVASTRRLAASGASAARVGQTNNGGGGAASGTRGRRAFRGKCRVRAYHAPCVFHE